MTVTQEQINSLLDSAEVREVVVFDKCLISAYKLPNGFIIVESSACVDPANFDVEIGRKICREHAETRLWELEGYVAQDEIASKHKRTPDEVKRSIESMSPEAREIYDALLTQITQKYPVNK